jgi:hypothetical protein
VAPHLQSPVSREASCLCDAPADPKAARSEWLGTDPAEFTMPSQAAPSKEMREKMATLHERMAVNLRSDKSVAECRTEMKSRRHTMGTQGCSMMGMGPGMGRGSTMKTLPPTTN